MCPSFNNFIWIRTSNKTTTKWRGHPFQALMSYKLVELKFTVTVGTLKLRDLRRCGQGVGPSEEGVVIKTQRKHPVQRGAKTFGWWSRRELGRGAEKPLPYSPSSFAPPANNLYWSNTMGNQQASWCSLCGNRVRWRSVQRGSGGAQGNYLAQGLSQLSR